HELTKRAQLLLRGRFRKPAEGGGEGDQNRMKAQPLVVDGAGVTSPILGENREQTLQQPLRRIGQHGSLTHNGSAQRPRATDSKLANAAPTRSRKAALERSR